MGRSRPAIDDAQPPHAGPPPAAPRRLRVLAGLIDAVIFAGPPIALQLRRMRDMRAGGEVRARPLWMDLLAGLIQTVQEQLGTPGERLLGLRTVDRRSGRRVSPWRTALIVSTRVALVLARRRSRLGAAQAAAGDRERPGDELQAMRARHADEAAGAAAAIVTRAPQGGAQALRRIAPLAAIALVHGLLRRRLAPTTVVVAQSPGPDSAALEAQAPMRG